MNKKFKEKKLLSRISPNFIKRKDEDLQNIRYCMRIEPGVLEISKDDTYQNISCLLTWAVIIVRPLDVQDQLWLPEDLLVYENLIARTSSVLDIQVMCLLIGGIPEWSRLVCDFGKSLSTFEKVVADILQILIFSLDEIGGNSW